jgi:hypothetical protein
MSEAKGLDVAALRERLVREARITGQHQSLNDEHVLAVVRIVNESRPSEAPGVTEEMVAIASEAYARETRAGSALSVRMRAAIVAAQSLRGEAPGVEREAMSVLVAERSEAAVASSDAQCAGPFADARDCPVHRPDVYRAASSDVAPAPATDAVFALHLLMCKVDGECDCAPGVCENGDESLRPYAEAIHAAGYRREGAQAKPLTDEQHGAVYDAYRAMGGEQNKNARRFLATMFDDEKLALPPWARDAALAAPQALPLEGQHNG